MRTLLLLVALGGCATAKVEPEKPAVSPPPAPATPAPQVKTGLDAWNLPDGCLLNLRGDWRDGKGRSFTIEDDGETVRILPAGATGGASLARSADGFYGHVTSQVTSASGRSCPAHFRARVTACAPDTLVFEVERAFLVDEACRRLPGPDAFDTVRLFRKDP